MGTILLYNEISPCVLQNDCYTTSILTARIRQANIMIYLGLGWSHVIRHPFRLIEGQLYHDILKYLRHCLYHVLQWAPQTIRVVILWYEEVTPGVVMSHCKMSPPHLAVRYHRYWIFPFAKPLSEQKRKTSDTRSEVRCCFLTLVLI